MFYIRCVALTEDVVYPLKPPFSEATRSHPEKAKSYEPKDINKTILPMRRKKSKHQHYTVKSSKKNRSIKASQFMIIFSPKENCLTQETHVSRGKEKKRKTEIVYS